ncbi:DUF4244 domain-containing protein [Streptomonospora litoralis]|uniref:DUF4244 domain-containing protein n=1 Tax=Streptomonospora litoralis TaxID=2498135 RepID=A0A4P6PZL7_9ACTN|nr:hypothetical protein EKD16_00795 [Streptomonospora litoralis]
MAAVCVFREVVRRMVARLCRLYGLPEPRLRGRPAALGDRGMSTAEYALGTVTACAFAAVLFAILTSAEVRDALTGIVTDALQIDA